VIIFGETIPTIAAKQNAPALAEKNALAIRALMTLFTPIVLPVVWITDRLIPEPEEKENDEEESEEAVQELQSIIEIAEDKDVIDEDQSELAQAAIDFSDTAAFEVMTARVDMECIDIDDDWDEILELCMNTTHSRIPVYEDSVDNIIGILTLNHFFKALAGAGGGRIDIRELLMPPLFVYKTMKMPTVLDRLRAARQHLAVVADEYGGTLGIVSMEDVLEEIVGDIWDENDVVEKEVVEKRDGSFELDGDMVISDFIELMELDEDEFETDSDTVGGWTIEMLEEYPKPGDSFEYGDLKVTVLGIDDLRVTRVKVERLGEKTE
jgi:CBS domain containing-hemolysin-like protein